MPAVERFVELGIGAAAALAVWTLARHRPALFDAIHQRVEKLANRRVLVIALVAIAPVALRLAVLAWNPVPVPRVHDDFGHLLVADTLLHGRLANPPHPLAEHLETVYVLQRPAYASIYPLGLGVSLAVGTALTGVPWAGVLMSVAAMGAALVWMLFGVARPIWAVLGGLAFTLMHGLFVVWSSSYRGGAVSAFAGALIVGALVRLRTTPSVRLGALAGAAWTAVWLTRPYEAVWLFGSVWVCIALLMTRARHTRGRWVATAAAIAAAQLLGGAITLAHNRAVTGSFTMLPYRESQQQYGVPQSLLWQPAISRREFPTPAQARVFARQQLQRTLAEREGGLERFRLRVNMVWKHFVGWWFLLPLLVALRRLRDEITLVTVTVVLSACWFSTWYAYFLTTYFAVYAGALALLVTSGLQRMVEWKPRALPVGVAIATFCVTATIASALEALRPDRAPRHSVRDDLTARLLSSHPKYVAFVRYTGDLTFEEEWVYNTADVDDGDIVWVRAMTSDKDAEVIRYYPGRELVRVDVDTRRVRVFGYRADSALLFEVPRY